ncbi:hypothetical protein Tco_0166492, partial [Tanacetum coccineum]
MKSSFKISKILGCYSGVENGTITVVEVIIGDGSGRKWAGIGRLEWAGIGRLEWAGIENSEISSKNASMSMCSGECGIGG